MTRSPEVYPKVMIDGDMDAGAWSCGMVVGLIHDIPSVKELIDRIMAGRRTPYSEPADGIAWRRKQGISGSRLSFFVLYKRRRKNDADLFLHDRRGPAHG